jgi:uncharacterized protein
MKKALIVQGGWDGHQPKQISEVFTKILESEDFSVEVSDTQEAFSDEEAIKSLDLIVPVWTMGSMEKELSASISKAVAAGVGIAGCHGGMCDAFRENVEWQFMTGGNWVAHPGGDGVEYTVNIKRASSTLVEGIKDFAVKTEHYYLHVDPAVEVLATTTFPLVKWYHSANGVVEMPVVWTKRWGEGRVFYNSLGHHADVFDIPEAKELMRRGFLWAAEGKAIAVERGLDGSEYESTEKMF